MFCARVLTRRALLVQVREALNVGWRIGESVRAAAMNMVASASSVGRSATRAAAGSFQEVGLFS